MHKRIIYLLPLLFVLTVLSQSINAQTVSADITLQELKDHMFILAADSLGGRCPDERGFLLAAHYAADQLKAARVNPILKDANGKETYFQMVPLVKAKTVVDKPLTVKTTTGEKVIQTLEDFKLQARGPSLTDVPVVFVGYGISEPDYGWNDLQNIETKGKVVLIMMGAPRRDGKNILPDSIHNSYASLMGTRKKVLSSPFFRQNMPAAVFVIADAEHTTQWNVLGDALTASQIVPKPKDQPLTLPPGPAMVGMIKGNLVKTLFASQRYNPLESEQEGLKGYQTFDLAGVTISFGLKTAGEEFESMNIVGVIRGTDESVSSEYITVGAHLDHVKPRNGQICNGADDNASGSIGVIEVAEAIAQKPLRRPVIFCLYTAEESGLLGSRYFVANPPVPLNQITVNVNLDMIGRSDAASKESRKHYVIGSDKANPDLRKLIEQVNSTTVQWPLDFESEDRSMAGSDHMSFHQKGIPVAFFFSGRHEDLHLPTDDAENIDYDKMLKLTKLIHALTTELGNRPQPMRSVAQ